MPATEKVTAPEPKKNPFKTPEGKTAVLLLPSDSYGRNLVEDSLLEQGYTIDDLPKIARDNEIRSRKLTGKHVIFTAVCIATAIGLKKRPEKYKLTISPPIDCAKFANSADEEDEFGEINAPSLVDALQKHVLPNVVKLSEEGSIRIMPQ